ncbi:MAG: hypothetical protein E2593_07065 [Stenotrophomonas sp.]|nr:hypothetical protein [Stenotrophomonas sp.]
MTTQPNTKCTCPSGDGSLRWPCPKHPPAAAPAEMSPEFTDTARAAIAWVLWHHQGASSPVGQPLRFALGMGADEPLPDWRIAEAKRYAAWAGATTAKFHEARAITPAAPGIDPDVLARDIHHAIADTGLAPLSPADNHTLREVIRSVIDASPKGDVHPDDLSVDAFAAAMKAKLADARAKGRGGWNGDEPGMQQRLSDMLRTHVEKGDPRDVANFCMFLHQRGEAIGPKGAAPAIQVPAGWALVPDRMQLTPENMELLADTLRGADEDEPWCGGVLWVGQTTDDDGEPTYYGLNVGNVECLEEGSINIVEFDPPAGSPKGGSEARDAARLDWLDANGFTAYRQVDPIDGLSGHCVVVHETMTPRRGNVHDTIRGAIDAAMQAQAGDAEVQP